MRFLKLDTGVIGGFDRALAGDVHIVRTGLAALLAAAWRTGGAMAILRALRPDADAARAVEGNLTRKRIRLPWLYGNRAVLSLYGGIKRWQAAMLRGVLDADLAYTPPGTVVIYNGSNYPESVLAAVAEAHGLRRVYVEAGFFPGTLQIDPAGLNGANSVPRDPAFYLEAEEDFAAGGLPHAVNDRAAKQAGAGAVDLAPGYVFVPFQVPSDMQVTLHSPWVPDMERFLDVIRAAADRHPDETFVIKEHPSFKRSVQGLRPAHPRVIFANDNVTSRLIREARCVVTLNSTVGLEALLLARPVITLGRACYNIEGLVQHADGPEALDAALRDTEWRPEPRLVRQFVGFLWTRYLVHGRYDDLPPDLAAQLEARAAWRP